MLVGAMFLLWTPPAKVLVLDSEGRRVVMVLNHLVDDEYWKALGVKTAPDDKSEGKFQPLKTFAEE
jgi:hypothetical protein